MVMEVVEDNIVEQRQGLINSDVTNAQLDWQLDSLSLKYITLVGRNEQTGTLACQATIHGKRDRKYWADTGPTWQWLVDDLEKSGHWEYHDISTFQYTVAESAEDPEFIIVSVVY